MLGSRGGQWPPRFSRRSSSPVFALLFGRSSPVDTLRSRQKIMAPGRSHLLSVNLPCQWLAPPLCVIASYTIISLFLLTYFILNSLCRKTPFTRRDVRKALRREARETAVSLRNSKGRMRLKYGEFIFSSEFGVECVLAGSSLDRFKIF